MDPLQVTIDPGWIAGLLLAMARVGGFVIASPLLATTFPPVGRLAFTIAVGASLAETVDSAESLDRLLAVTFVNAALGIALGWLTSVIFHLFSIAGSVVDFGAGLSIGQVFDPLLGAPAAVFGRWFPTTAMALLVVSGGLTVVLGGLDRSISVIPLDGSVVADSDLYRYAAMQVGQLMVVGLELALPLAATLVVAEVLLGMASRLMPQFNVFMLGLPAKIWISLVVLSVLMLRFPGMVGNVIEVIERAFIDVLRGFVA